MEAAHGKVYEIDPKTMEPMVELKKIPDKLTVHHFFLNNKKLPLGLRGYRISWEEEGIGQWDDKQLEEIRELINEYREELKTCNIHLINEDLKNKQRIKQQLDSEESHRGYNVKTTPKHAKRRS